MIAAHQHDRGMGLLEVLITLVILGILSLVLTSEIVIQHNFRKSLADPAAASTGMVNSEYEDHCTVELLSSLHELLLICTHTDTHNQTRITRVHTLSPRGMYEG